jgi:hypothetical protein
MATRATIYILSEDKQGVHQDYKVYKHWSGNPEATLEWLEDFNKSFSADRGDDPQYKFAQLLRSSSRDSRKYGLDDSNTTGWGVVPIDADCNEEWEYYLNVDGTVTHRPVERHYDENGKLCITYYSPD